MRINFKCGEEELIDYYLYFWYKGLTRRIIISAVICGILSVVPFAFGIHACMVFAETGQITLGLSCLLIGIMLLSYALIVAFCYRPSFVSTRCLKALRENPEKLNLLSSDFFISVENSLLSYRSLEKGQVSRSVSDVALHVFSKLNVILIFSDGSSTFVPKSAFKENEMSEFLGALIMEEKLWKR